MTKTSTTLIDYRKLALKDLVKQIDETQLKLQELRNQLTIGKLKSYNQIHDLRRSIAQMETVRNEKIMLEAISHG
ncbi:MAG: 50S ribosomal protein L29 [Patescibacteria group bacterium]|jgi:ribosomal protein L29